MASKNIAFDQIPSSIRKPGKQIEFNTRLAVSTLPANRQLVLIVGQMLPTGTAEPLQSQTVFSDVMAAELFGRGSMAAIMAERAIKANPYLNLSIIGIPDDAQAIAASGSVKLAGTASGSGVISLYVGQTRVDISARNGDTAETLMATLQTAVSKLLDLPLTAEVSQAAVVLTARNKGAAGNDIILRVASTVAGITTTLTPMSGGAIDPDVKDALAAVFAGGHNILICPYATDEAITAFRDHLDAVSHPLEQRGAIGVAGWRKSFSTGTTLTRKINSGRFSVAWHNGSVMAPFEIAAGYGAVMASEEDPARPYNTLSVLGLDVTPLESRPGRTEQEAALYNGLTPLEVGAGDKVRIVRAISTYMVNDAGADDISLLDITTIRTLDYVRKAILERWELRFPREKLSERTRAKVRSETIDVLYKLEALEIIERVTENLEKLLVERDEQDPNRINTAIPADVVNGLHVMAGRIDLYL